MYLWYCGNTDYMITSSFESSTVFLVCTRLSHQVQEELVHHISVLRSQADAKKLKLSKLRVEVLEGPTVRTCTNLFIVQDFIWGREGAKEASVLETYKSRVPYPY